MLAGCLCRHGCWGAGYDRTEDNIEPIVHYCEEACTRCLAIEQDTKRKVSSFAYIHSHMSVVHTLISRWSSKSLAHMPEVVL